MHISLLIAHLTAKLTKECAFFPDMHRLLFTNATGTPPAVTRGVGRNGRQTTFYQAPDGHQPAAAPPLPHPVPDHLIDPALRLAQPAADVQMADITNVPAQQLAPPHAGAPVTPENIPPPATPAHLTRERIDAVKANFKTIPRSNGIADVLKETLESVSFFPSLSIFSSILSPVFCTDFM